MARRWERLPWPLPIETEQDDASLVEAERAARIEALIEEVL